MPKSNAHTKTDRLKETLWHATQVIQETPEGCEMTISIGAALEIENWVRSWGPDCEVLEPISLREKMIEDVQRTARMYGVAFHPPLAPGELDETLFNDFFGGV